MLLSKKSSSDLRINFIKSHNFDDSTVSKVMDWLLSIGKGIFIIAFLIIVITFFNRYQLDSKLDVLKTQIDSTINSLDDMKNDEQQIVFFQNQLNKVAAVTTNYVDNGFLLRTLQANLPVRLHLTKLNIKNDEITFSGEADDEAVLADFLVSLKLEEKFTQIDINSISSGGVQNPTVKFAIKLTFSPDANQDLVDTNSVK